VARTRRARVTRDTSVKNFARIRGCFVACGLALLCAIAACSPATKRNPRAPDAEFLLVSDDSTTWVRSTSDSLIVRRAPMLVAALDGRLIELFVADETIGFEEASFLVSRLYRRDLVTRDSTLVFADSVVLRDAMTFMRSHPSAERLPDDEEPESALRAVESSITPLEIIGGTIGLDIHIDRTVGEFGTHDTYRATIDLKTGRRLALPSIVTPAAARAAFAVAHTRLSDAVSMAGSGGDVVGRAASTAMSALRIDSLGFALTRIGDSLAASWIAHSEQVIDETRDTHRYDLQPVPVTPPSWWSTVRSTLAVQRPDSSSRFALNGLTLELRYDREDVASISAHSQAGVLPVTRMSGPVRRVIAIADTLIAPAGQWRRALQRAFSESEYYSDQVRAAAFRPRRNPASSPRSL
jgi:hypothetical protein